MALIDKNIDGTQDIRTSPDPGFFLTKIQSEFILYLSTKRLIGYAPNVDNLLVNFVLTTMKAKSLEVF
jgi:hypothetical protein